ncbi:MAG: phosphoribosylanthranilate isomerase [Actinobacteria bacterium]|nr:MAG: phosphoribosylanthranilate isomerase [Actinomycetota bacterium]
MSARGSPPPAVGSDALLAVALGADAIGFMFAPSPRQLQPVRARDIVRRLPGEVLTVGVFRDESRQRVVDIVNQVGLKCAQLHGHETAADTLWIREHVPFVIKAFIAGDPRLEQFDEYGADVAMIDSEAPGSGRVFDWSLAEGAPQHRRVMLAGGLTPENITAAVRRTRPWGVDVSTGVERAPGRKDPIKLRAFIERAKASEKKPYRGVDEEPYD